MLYTGRLVYGPHMCVQFVTPGPLSYSPSNLYFLQSHMTTALSQATPQHYYPPLLTTANPCVLLLTLLILVYYC